MRWQLLLDPGGSPDPLDKHAPKSLDNENFRHR